MRAFLTHRRLREEAIFKRLEKGDRKIMEVVRAVYAEVDPRLHPAAAMSTLAHVEHLIERDRVRTDGALTLEMYLNLLKDAEKRLERYAKTISRKLETAGQKR